jgi:outer membrane lipoprotein-sorting protein
MKMFKKIMAVALVGVMALSMLTGCAITNAIIEDKAEDALENAWSTIENQYTAAHKNVQFKSGKFTSTDAYKKAEKAVKAGLTVEEGKAVLFTENNDANYTVVVVAEPSSAKKVKSWKALAGNVLEAAGWTNGIWVTTGNKAKVDIVTGIEGKNAKDDSKKDTYTIFVFAKTETAYNK